MGARLLFARLLELPKRVVSYDKGIEAIKNGEDNDYPERVERLIDHSITAKQCRKLFRQYLTGKGFDGLNEIKVNKDGSSLLAFTSRFIQEYATHGGVYVHVMHNAAGLPVSYTVVPYTKMRKGKKDSKNYSGKYAKLDDWVDGSKKDVVWFNAFSTDPEIVQKNIENAGGIDKYKGQIYFFNPSNIDYPLAHIHPVMNDTDSEFRAGVFKNKSLRKGFFGKNILVTPPRIDPVLTSVDRRNLSEEERLNLTHQEKAAEDVTETLKSFVGVENNEGFMSLEMELEGDDIDKAIKHIKIDTDIDDKLFEYTEGSTSNNIRKAYNNVPVILVDSSDHSIFGNSGEAILQAKMFYQEQTHEERMLIEQAFKVLFKNYNYLKDKVLTITPLINGSNNA